MKMLIEEFTNRLSNDVYNTDELMYIFNNNNNYYIKSIVANKLNIDFDYKNGENYDVEYDLKGNIVVETNELSVDILKYENEKILIEEIVSLYKKLTKTCVVINIDTFADKIRDEYLNEAYTLYKIDINKVEFENEELMEIEEIIKVYYRSFVEAREIIANL